jgi:hypothetical protein
MPVHVPDLEVLKETPLLALLHRNPALFSLEELPPLRIFDQF